MATRLRPGDRPRPPLSASQQHTTQFVLLALAALISVRLPLPWMAIAIPCVIAADVEGIRTMRALTRERARATFRAWIICGIALISLLGIGVASTVALYPVTYDRQECLAGANTSQAKAACEAEYDRRVHGIDLRLLH